MRGFILLLTLGFVAPVVADETPVNEIYETYLPAEKLVPVLEPLLGPEDRITPFRNKLIVHAPRSSQDKVLDILEDIDRPLRNLLIEVRFASTSHSESSGASVGVKYKDANTGVHINPKQQNNDQVIVYKGSSRDDKIQVRAVAKQRFTTENDNSLSQIRVLEGNQGFLQVGEEYPVQQFVFLQPNGFGSTTEYRMAGSGVYVIPQIVKDKIRLELYTTQQKPQGRSGTIEKTDAQSVLIVEPDVWTPFAGMSTDTQQQGNGHTLSTRDLKHRNQNLELRVTILN